MIHRLHLIIPLLAVAIYAQTEVECNFDIDILSVSAVSGGYYAFDLQFDCDTYEVSQYGFTIWPSLPHFEADSAYNAGDRIIWGRNLLDTTAYTCNQALPYAGISPLDNDSSFIYWSPSDSLAELDINFVNLDSTLGVTLSLNGRAQYHNIRANEPHIIRAYFVDQSDSIHVYPFYYTGFPLLFTGAQVDVELSQDIWDFSIENNVFDGFCWTDTIVVSGRLTGYFNEPIRGATAWIPGYQYLIVSDEIQVSDQNGNFDWQLHFPSTFIPPINPENCEYPNCDECIYPNYQFDMMIYSRGIQQFGSDLFYFQIQRSRGECASCSMIGDLNSDLEFDITDITILIEIILQVEEASEYEMWSGDMDENGYLNILDVIGLLEYVLEN